MIDAHALPSEYEPVGAGTGSAGVSPANCGVAARDVVETPATHTRGCRQTRLDLSCPAVRGRVRFAQNAWKSRVRQRKITIRKAV
jgi:hypothetical protein